MRKRLSTVFAVTATLISVTGVALAEQKDIEPQVIAFAGTPVGVYDNTGAFVKDMDPAAFGNPPVKIHGVDDFGLYALESKEGKVWFVDPIDVETNVKADVIITCTKGALAAPSDSIDLSGLGFGGKCKVKEDAQ